MSNKSTHDDNTTELGDSILQGLEEALAYARGELTEEDGIKVYCFDELDVKKIRSQLGLTQQEFARFINSSARSVQHWEQKTREPEGPTRVLLELIARDPKMVWNTLNTPPHG